jgi:phospholipid/cholesterol/gamma-HCH transport system ATP-binding protein
VVVIGGSGSGKSVLLKCILGLLEADGGSIQVDGVETIGLKSIEREKILRKFGMLFQGSALFDSLRVWENVAFRLIYSERKSNKAARAKAIDCLAQVGLAREVGELSPAELSGGMQKRVALARAIAADPKVLFFDEPTTGLDPITSRTVDELMVHTREQFGVTGIVITHDMASVFKIADRINYLYEGQITASGTPAEFLGSEDPATRDFLEASGVGTSAVFAHRA